MMTVVSNYLSRKIQILLEVSSVISQHFGTVQYATELIASLPDRFYFPEWPVSFPTPLLLFPLLPV